MTQATPIRRSARRLRPTLLAPVVALLLLFGAGSASAGDDDLFQLLPSSFRYPESFLVDREVRLVERYIGPREWDAPAYRARVARLLGR